MSILLFSFFSSLFPILNKIIPRTAATKQNQKSVSQPQRSIKHSTHTGYPCSEHNLIILQTMERLREKSGENTFKKSYHVLVCEHDKYRINLMPADCFIKSYHVINPWRKIHEPYVHMALFLNPLHFSSFAV